MIPYLRLPDLTLIPESFVGTWPRQAIVVHPFGLLVVVAIWCGIALSLRQARRARLPTAAVLSYVIWLVGFGFVGGHILDLLFYYRGSAPEPGAWLRLSDGQSSFGGFIGAVFGSWLWSKFYRCSARPFAEAVASAFPSAWVIGRLGCAVVHDHPGRASTALWAVAYPDFPRLDMGLLEAALTLPMAVAFLWLRRRSYPQGFFLATLSLYYAPVRFVLDFSRATDMADADARYLYLTPAQWGCIGLFAAGMYLLAGAIARTHAKRSAMD
jgi:phosphatidylglycerol:prolipoprotein diacylglycerol transferase